MSDATSGVMRPLTPGIVYFVRRRLNLIVLFTVHVLVSVLVLAGVKRVFARLQAISRCIHFHLCVRV